MKICTTENLHPFVNKIENPILDQENPKKEESGV